MTSCKVNALKSSCMRTFKRHATLQACRRLDVDLVYFDLSQALPFKLVIRDLDIAIKRGIHFEISYNSAFSASTEGRTILIAASQSETIVPGSLV